MEQALEGGRGRRIGRYVLYEAFAAGGMASVHLARAVGTGGFARTVAIKRLHPNFAKDAEFVAMLVDEARLTSRIHHPGVVAMHDVISDHGELFLVMEYVAGESLAKLLAVARERSAPVPIAVAAAILIDTLEGLDAAHLAVDGDGRPLEIVHRDVSPQNILVGVDGTARLLDFGVAKAAARSQTTRDGDLKGKVSYMAPEQLRRQAVDHRADIYAAGVVAWEMLTGRRLFTGNGLAEMALDVLQCRIETPSTYRPDLPARLEETILRALSAKPEDRYASAHAFAGAIEAAVTGASSRQVAAWVEPLAADAIALRAARVASIEKSATDPTFVESTRASDQETAKESFAVDSVRPAEARPPRRVRRKWPLPVALAMSVIAGLLLTSWWRAPRSTASVAESAPPDEAPLAQAPEAPMAVDEPAMLGRADPLPPAVAPLIRQSASHESAQRGGGLPRGGRPHPEAVPVKSATARATGADCATLYTVDEAGIKRFKPQCFVPH